MASKRVEGDAYYTERPLANALTMAMAARLVLKSATPRILEPSAGGAVFCATARHFWPAAHITAVDVTPRPKTEEGAAANEWHECSLEAADRDEKLGTYDLALGNPPYTHAEEHLRIARANADHVAFLLRLSFLGSQGRAERIFSLPGLRHIIPIAERPSFIHGKTDNSEYALFIWSKHYTGLAEVSRPLWWRK